MATIFTLRTRAIIRQIPRGKVSTYGIIATYAGNHLAARQVGRILHSSSKKYNLPWQRVINGKGELSYQQSAKLQRKLLENEGIDFLTNGKIDLNTYLWWPDT